VRTLALVALLAAPAAFAYELNGVPLGGNEAQVKKAFPSARCKPLEWSSRVADRRCDDAKIAFGGVPARLTVYLKADSIQALSVRFDTKDRDKVVAHFTSRWGAPAGEASETIARKGKDGKRVYKLRWERGNEHAMLVAQADRKRASLEAWRGNFVDEIYRVR
jgi:hypothetical protein